MTFGDKIKNFFGHKALDDEVFEDLTDLLVEGDFGAAEAYKLSDELQTRCKKHNAASGDDARRELAGLLEEILAKAKPAPVLQAGSLAIILLLGVNGVGKTTTAAKLANLYAGQGRKPILAAGDTFRAAAIEQLKIHGERLGVRVVAHQHGGDPAAVMFDAIEAAKSGADARDALILGDTAGRMHTKAGLVEELKKIDRIVETKTAGDKDAQYLKYLVLDATTGRNAFAQAETFGGAVAPDGIVLTKADSSAKGGVIFSLASEMRLPVVFV
jgi:fused signal recognition particle receptor